MIPRIIHCCWFGKNQYPPLVNKCMQSWGKKLPNYKIIIWDEEKFDINCNKYVKEAYNRKQFAFVSDYVRLYALYNYGGIYMDTDIEVVNNFDNILINKAFIGFESKDYIMTGIMASEKNNKLIKKFLNYYDNINFIKEDDTSDLTTNVYIITKILISLGLTQNGKEQVIQGMRVFPYYYFSPNTILQVFGLTPKSKKIYAVHHGGGGWRPDGKKIQPFSFRLKRYIVCKLRMIIGTDKVVKIKYIFKYDKRRS